MKTARQEGGYIIEDGGTCGDPSINKTLVLRHFVGCSRNVQPVSNSWAQIVLPDIMP